MEWDHSDLIKECTLMYWNQFINKLVCANPLFHALNDCLFVGFRLQSMGWYLSFNHGFSNVSKIMNVYETTKIIVVVLNSKLYTHNMLRTWIQILHGHLINWTASVTGSSDSNNFIYVFYLAWSIRMQGQPFLNSY